jgi:hypothetical protein
MKNGNGKSSKIIAQTKFLDVHLMRPTPYARESAWPFVIGQHTRVQLDPRAGFALQCLERWGMVAGATDGEDSAGRAKLRSMAPDEMVERACDVADKAYAAFEARGWTLTLPSAEELVDHLKDVEDRND